MNPKPDAQGFYTVWVDKRGRITLPKGLREEKKIELEGWVKIKAKKGEFVTNER